MDSAAENEKIGNHFSLFSPEATAASKQLNEMTSYLGFTHLWSNLKIIEYVQQFTSFLPTFFFLITLHH